MKICIIGNSKRLSVLKENLANENFDVSSILNSDEIYEYIDHDIVVLPVPTMRKDGFVNLDGSKKITIEHLINIINPNSLIISCGYFNQSYKVVDLNLREDFAYLNAIPTAEGAIYYALDNTDISLYESKILITGFGRVAKLLADRLKGLCKRITISARSPKDLAYAEALSFDIMHIDSLKDNIHKFDIIYQTVPSKLITPEIINNMSIKNTIIELSSKSVGTDCIYAKEKGIKVIDAPALPEKISPISAGNILTKSVLSIISEHKGSVYSE